jgi:peptide/nickel transport system substrate-binding protein
MSSPNVTVGYLVPEFEVWNMQYAPLVDKAAEDFSPEPGLAESWEVSEDGLSVTYTLREGLLWSDGTPLTAGVSPTPSIARATRSGTTTSPPHRTSTPS